jgi:hypothetical protein
MIYYDLYHPKVEVFSSPTTVTPMERLTSMVVQESPKTLILPQIFVG